jgi:hypothetical protein
MLRRPPAAEPAAQAPATRTCDKLRPVSLRAAPVSPPAHHAADADELLSQHAAVMPPSPVSLHNAGLVTSVKRERGCQGPTICTSASPTISVVCFKDSRLSQRAYGTALQRLPSSAA